MKYQDKIANLQEENKQLKEDLRVSQSNEETYELEMQEITKILGLDEDTLFDDVKDYAKQLKEQLENKIDLYEDTISYQLGFDKGKEYLQQRIDKAIEYFKYQLDNLDFYEDTKAKMLCAMGITLLQEGDKENER